MIEKATTLARAISATAAQTSVQLLAAGIAFYATLALFPALAALVALYGVWADPQVIPQHMEMLRDILPTEVYGIVEGELLRLLGSETSRHGLALGLWVLLALWLARAGVNGLIAGLDQVHRRAPPRAWWDRLARSLVLTVVLVLFAIVALTAVVIAPVVLAFIPLGPFAATALEVLRILLGVFAVMGAIATLYRFGPRRAEGAGGFHLTYGVVTATTLWIIGSMAFSAYLRNFDDYNEIYGGFGAVIALIMWFYLSAYAVLFGALLDAEVAAGRTDSRP
ncbi:MAG: YihY/virulence factor BrkB family protein [Pseudomonadota bacterium]